MKRSSSTIIRCYSILPWLITIAIQSVECFTRPPTFSRVVTIPEKKPTAGVLSPSKTTLLQTHDNDDVITAATTTVASKSPDGTLDNDETAQPKASRKNPTLAELEDLEEARLAAEEKAAAAQQKLLQEQEEQFNGPSNLYTDVYNVNPKSISKIDPSQFLTTNDIVGGDDDPMNISPQKEMDLAKKRDALQNSRLNEMFAEEDSASSQRQKRIQELMKEDDKVWKEQRRKKLLGKYAEVDSWEEVEKMLGEDRKKEVKGMFIISFVLVCSKCIIYYVCYLICSSCHLAILVNPHCWLTQTEMEMKVDIAKKAGVSLTMLEPTETTSDDTKDAKLNFNPTIGVSGKGPSWFTNEDEMNIDLESEFQSLKEQSSDGNANDGENASPTQSTAVTSDVTKDGPKFVDGKLTSREQLMGISVGSAGGWSLEVFPGDFVVHRKYGIGRYEKTVLKPKSKLTPEEKDAAEVRRKEMINDLMRDGRQLEEIQRVVETFGTDQDTDPISNPLSTLLEIAYSDAVVHVPIDRAYRLSRYRAGDAAIKPRLSRVKGEAWSKAKRKVEVSTVQMAEDVLALYATRETLNRPPFDPSKEQEVKQFSKSFSFEPTADQKKCFEDVENDMVWRSRPMDRLICGDVGFGKTEVAMRALFRSVANGRQAALLAPTGVLAAQHYKNVIKRSKSPFFIISFIM